MSTPAALSRPAEMQQIVLSPLPHTWFLDLDGTLLRHNGHLTGGGDTLLAGAEQLLDQIPPGDMVVIVTSRAESHREQTVQFLDSHAVRYDHIIFGAPVGERILVNDTKPSGLQTAIAVNLTRDKSPGLRVRTDPSL